MMANQTVEGPLKGIAMALLFAAIFWGLVLGALAPFIPQNIANGYFLATALIFYASVFGLAMIRLMRQRISSVALCVAILSIVALFSELIGREAVVRLLGLSS